NEDERLQARINQLVDKLEATLRQSLRIAQAAHAWHGDATADAAVLIAYVIGRWQLFAKSCSDDAARGVILQRVPMLKRLLPALALAIAGGALFAQAQPAPLPPPPPAAAPLAPPPSQAPLPSAPTGT